ncbi:MAG: hypothetical protein WA081_20520 [Desulfosalsimonadaceae bacterium]
MRMIRGEGDRIDIRQQVRIYSHVGTDISFTPDIVVTPQAATIGKRKDSDYAGGKRTFFFVDSKDVIAAHECKSMVPFPELLVSFIGMLMAGHEWVERLDSKDVMVADGAHLAPCLFVGGSARSLHLRMIKGLKTAYPMNIVVGMHSGTWDLLGDNADIRRMKNPLIVEQSPTAYPGGRADKLTAKTQQDELQDLESYINNDLSVKHMPFVSTVKIINR